MSSPAPLGGDCLFFSERMLELAAKTAAARGTEGHPFKCGLPTGGAPGCYNPLGVEMFERTLTAAGATVEEILDEAFGLRKKVARQLREMFQVALAGEEVRPTLEPSGGSS